jgi:uncharacterized OsmC-like protein
VGADRPADRRADLVEPDAARGGDALDPDVRKGYQDITVRFSVKGDAPAEKLRALVEQSRNRSAVYDILTNHVPVRIEIDTD